jgi:hypothetical protein
MRRLAGKSPCGTHRTVIVPADGLKEDGILTESLNARNAYYVPNIFVQNRLMFSSDPRCQSR